MCRQRSKAAGSLQALRPPPIAWRRPAAAARASTGIRAARRCLRLIAGSASRIAPSRSISRRGTCGASNRANCADRVGALHAGATCRRRAWKSRPAERKRSRSARLAARSERRSGSSGCTRALPCRERTGVWLPRPLVHALRRAGDGRHSAGVLRSAIPARVALAWSRRRGGSAVGVLFTFPPARSPAFFLTLDS